MLWRQVRGQADHHEEVGGVARGGQDTPAVAGAVDGALVVRVRLEVGHAKGLEPDGWGLLVQHLGQQGGGRGGEGLGGGQLGQGLEPDGGGLLIQHLGQQGGGRGTEGLRGGLLGQGGGRGREGGGGHYGERPLRRAGAGRDGEGGDPNMRHQGAKWRV